MSQSEDTPHWNLDEPDELPDPTRRKCLDCRGDGIVDGEECRSCRGYGYIVEDESEGYVTQTDVRQLLLRIGRRLGLDTHTNSAWTN